MRLYKSIATALLAATAFIAPHAARAGFDTSGSLGGVGSRLKDGTVYTVFEDKTITRGSIYSATYVDDNATTVIYIHKGVTLTIQGGDASGKYGAGAGIRLNSGSTLIVTGEGTLNVKGGNAAKGGKGSGASAARCDNDYTQGGKGGDGGAGGGGASAAIGGVGGDGGSAGVQGTTPPTHESSVYVWSNFKDTTGADGGGGGNGENGTDSGTIYLLGSVTVNASGGAKASGGAAGSRGSGAWFSKTYEFHAGYGGGGGGGGGGAAATCNIGGGGGAGGGGGGAGGNGGHFWTTRGGNPDVPDASGGRKGSGADGNDGDGWTDSPSHYKSTYGGSGGSGGSAGTTGSSGTCYKDSGVTVSGTGNFLSASTHPAIEYKLFFHDDWRHSSTNDVKLGYAMPESAPVLTREGYTFLGWFDRKDGMGLKHYDADGSKLIDTYCYVGDLTLYAGWQLDSGTAASIQVAVDDGDPVGITPGTSANGTGWSYNGDNGYLLFSSSAHSYTVSGIETNGEVCIWIGCDSTVNISSLALDTSRKADSAALVVFENRSPTISVNGASRLKSSAGMPAIYLANNAYPTITGDSSIMLVGGEGGPDIGIYDTASSASVNIDTVNPDIHLGTSRFTNSVGRSATFVSSLTAERLWPVKVPNVGTQGKAISWSGLPDAYSPSHTIADEHGNAYLWLPDGTYFFSSVVSTDAASDAQEWVARVNGAHRTAERFSGKGLFINHLDVGYLSGPGWYFDENQTVCLTNGGPFVVSGSTSSIGLRVKSSCDITFKDVSFQTQGIFVSALTMDQGCSVNLTLEGSNSVNSGGGDAGIRVESGQKLSIYGDGSLSSRGGRGAGIGGNQNGTCGTIEIYGGTVTARSGDGGAGIGSGYDGSGGSILIAGGTVVATGGYNGAGIGGGYNATGATIKITGGDVTAAGGHGSAGIGCGRNYTFNTETGDTVEISGGIVRATNTDFSAGTLGSSYGGKCKSVKITGGTFLKPDDGTVRILASDSVLFCGGSIRAQSNAIVPTASNGSAEVHRVAVTGLVANAKQEITWFNRSDGPYGLDDIYSDEYGVIYLWLPAATYYFKVGGMTYRAIVKGVDTIASPWTAGVMVDGVDISELRGDGWMYDDFTLALASSNHVVSGINTASEVGIVVRSGGDYCISNLVLNAAAGNREFPAILLDTLNKVTLQIEGSNELACNGGHAAIEVEYGKSLAIMGSGSLSATGGNLSAGIGSGEHSDDTGVIRIEGGSVTAVGGPYAAGIGGAQYHSGGSILISGGNVVATGGDFGAGVGGGREASAGIITIQNDCTVNATGGKYAAGIGCGHDCVGGTIKISGGTVMATGGMYSAGIGTGYDYTAERNLSSCEITISGGTVTATGASDGAGIGSGYNYARVSRSNTYVTISGGTVTAIGAGDGAGIGGGRKQECGSIEISGGIVSASSLRGAAIGSGAYSKTRIGAIGIFGGTVKARASAYSAQDIGAGVDATGEGSILIGGGSIDARFHADEPHEQDYVRGRVWPITIAGLPAKSRIVSLEPEEGSLGTVGAGWAASYGTNDVYADEDGKIYVWLRNGVYDIVVTTSDDAAPPLETVLEYTAFVADGETEAKPYEPIGILVNWRDVGHFVGKGWNQDNAFCVHLDTSREYVLSGMSISEDRKGRIGFDIEADRTDIVFSNLVLNLSAEPPEWGVPAPYGHIRSAFTVHSGVSATFTLCETNSVVAGLGAGIHVPSGATAKVLGDGYLEIYGGDYGNPNMYDGCDASGAAIGGVSYETSGTVEIDLSEGGEIVAYGGYSASGIGAGAHGNNGTVLIQSGTVTANGSVVGGIASSGGAGIGGGYSNSDESYGSGGTITILGGLVTATGGGETHSGSYYNGAAGVGGGYRGSGGSITISNATVVAKGFASAAGIGGGEEGATGNIVIDGGDVTAVGGQYAMGIGSGRGDHVEGSCRISGGVVHAKGGDYAAGIGGVGSVEISGGIVYADGGYQAAGIGGSSHASGCPVTISGGTVFPTPGAQGSGYGAARPPSAIGPGDYTGYSDSPVLCKNQFDGGAIYVGRDLLSSAPSNRYNYAVHIVDFEIGIPTSVVTSLTLELLRVNSAQRSASFFNYGKKDLCTNADGYLRLWLPSTGSGAFIATVVMEDGSVHYFCFAIGEDGTVSQEDFLVVNGDFITGTDDQSGTGWSFKKDTGIITLNEDSSVQGIATNGAYRILVPNGGASTLDITNLDFTSMKQQHASAIVFSNDCNFVVSGDKMNTICATGQYSAGLEVALGTTLTIMGDGLLTVSGGSNGAGIGSRCGFGSPGKIVINSGTIFAKGGEKAAGIGGGISSDLATDNIEINGGVVTALGGRLAAGIGAGYMGAVSGSRKALASEAVRITGGTVVAERGSTDATISDMISSGNAVNVTSYEDALVISGGNVHGLSRKIVPVPRDESKASLRYCLFTGLTPGERPVFSSGLPESYGMNDLVVDYTGSVCVWLPATNAVRSIIMDGEYFAGGGETNNVFAIGKGGEWPESMSGGTSGGGQGGEGGQQEEPLLWRVSIRGLPAVSGFREVSGLESFSVTDVVVSEAGNATIYLPTSGTQYDFSVAGLEYHALVSDAPSVAWYETGVTVDGVDLGTADETEGWSYNGATGILSLKNASQTYTIAGTNSHWDVAVRSEAKGVKVVGDMLCLRQGEGYLSTATNSFTFEKGSGISIVNGTIAAYASDSLTTVLGGSVDAALSMAVDSSGATLHKVTVGGFEPGAGVSGPTTIATDSSSSSLAGYDFTGAVADGAGCIYIWLPDACYEFAFGDIHYMVTVAGADVEARSFRNTGVYINGVDAGKPEGEFWRNEGGRVVLYNDRHSYGDYVITGTNTGEAVVFSVQIKSQVLVRLENLVMDNAAMTDSPFTVASGSTTPLFSCGGTNILTSVIDGYPAVRVPARNYISFGTNVVAGILYATGAGNAPAFGPAEGEDPGVLIFWGGTVIAAGGPEAEYDLKARDNLNDDFRIMGASLKPARTGVVTPSPICGSINTNPLWCVAIPGFDPGELVGEDIYSKWEFMDSSIRHPGNGWIADGDGAVYMWLTNGVYTIQHKAGSSWRAVVDGSNTIAVYDGVPSSLAIQSVSVSGGVLTIIVSGEPRGSAASVVDRISVLASDNPGDLMSGGSTSVAALTSFDGIGTADNPDGTVTVTVPLSVTGDKRFFKIVTE